jgi:thiol-disulfide isomerase/thioredoxin
LNLGPFAFSTALIALLFGLIAALGTAGFLRKRGQPDAGNAAYLALAAGLLLARIAYVVGWRRQYLEQPLSIFNVRDGGFDPVAGLVGLVLATALIGWRRPALRKALAASVAIGVAGWGFATLAAQLLRDATRQPLPAIALRDLAGREVSLPSLRGQPLVINLWATWCGPCRSELPMLVEAQRRLPQVRFVFADQGESASIVGDYLRKAGLAPQHVLIDGNLDLSAHYGVRGYPTTLFLDADGVLRDRQMGELSRATLADRLRRVAPQR